MNTLFPASVRRFDLIFASNGPLLILLLTLAAGVSANAQTISASAQFTDQPAGGNLFNYTITLDNSAASSSAIGTFWFAWTPTGDFLPSNPNLVTPPTGWSDTITHFGAGDGYGIEFVANGPANAIAPGHSLDFNFETLDSPAALAGNSPYYPTTPVGTSFVYGGGPFSGPSDQFVVVPAPEPSFKGLSILAVFILWLGRQKYLRHCGA